MRFFKILGILALTGLMAACSRVPNGNVGLRVNMFGGDRGVDINVLEPGRYFVWWNQEMYLFPTFIQNHTWEGDNRIQFQTKEGLGVANGVGISYSVTKERARDVFIKYRRGIEEVTDRHLHNMIRDSLVRRASTLSVEEVYGSGKSALLDGVLSDIRERASVDGIEIASIYWIGDMILPPSVKESINNKILATQRAEQRQNEVKESEAEAKKAEAIAQGKANSMLMITKAEAEAIDIKGKAIAANPSIIQLTAIERWDGKLPQVTSGDDKGVIPFINMK